MAVLQKCALRYATISFVTMITIIIIIPPKYFSTLTIFPFRHNGISESTFT